MEISKLSIPKKRKRTAKTGGGPEGNQILLHICHSSCDLVVLIFFYKSFKTGKNLQSTSNS